MSEGEVHRGIAFPPPKRTSILFAGLFLPIFLMSSHESAAHHVASAYALKPISFPGGSGVIQLDHMAYDQKKGRVWVPASNTGKVDVIDVTADAVSQISEFKTGDVELEGQRVQLGPTAVTIGEGVVYVGNRGDSTITVIDAQTLARGESVSLNPGAPETGGVPHGLVYVGATRELWATTGPGKSIEVFDASDARHLKWKLTIHLDGSTEGCAVDNQRGRFYTNIVETGKTAVIDLRSHKVISNWDAGSHDRQGLAMDVTRGFLFVACADRVVSLDVAHGGKVIDSVTTGAGIDDIDFSQEQKVLYAAASVTATLAVIEVGDDGKFHLAALLPTTQEARGVIAAGGGAAYIIDPLHGGLLKLFHQ